MSTSSYTELMVTEIQEAAEVSGSLGYEWAKEYASANGLKLRSVVAKIISLGLKYVPKAKVTKAGAPVVKKEVFVSRVEKALESSFPSLIKATKADLENLANVVENSLGA